MSISDETIRFGRQMRLILDASTSQTVRRLVKAWAEAWDEIHDDWATIAMDIAKATHDGTPLAPSVLLRQKRVENALALATDFIHDLSDLTGVTVFDALGNVIDETVNVEFEILASQFPLTVQPAVKAGLARVEPQALEEIVARTMDQIHASTRELSRDAQAAMRRSLIHGVAVGANPRETAARMIKRAEGAFNGGLTRAMTIARTETLDVHRGVAQGVQTANRDILDGWQWIADLTPRTCPSCWAMHGQVFDLSVAGPADHPNGRCARMAKVKSWRDLGFYIDEPPSVVPDAQATFDALSVDDQMRVLGPGRMIAYQHGVPLADMAALKANPEWRDSYVPTPVDYLLRDLDV